MMNDSIQSLEGSEVKQEERREKICISISEGCIRHYNEEPEVEEQFILRLPEKDAKVVHEAIETNTLGKRLNICVEKNQRNSTVILDGKQMQGKFMDLPTIVESYKSADDSTLYKTADISQILICDSSEDFQAAEKSNSGAVKKNHAYHTNRKNEYKYASGLCPPLKNVRKNRFRKIQLEENFDPDVDRAVKLLLRADGAAERVEFEIAYEDSRDTRDKFFTGINENQSTIDDKSSQLTASNEVDVFGETLSVSSSEDFPTDLDNNNKLASNYRQCDNDFDFDSDIGNIEKYDLETITEEQKQHLAQLKEIDYCLSTFDLKSSPPRSASRDRGRGRGRGRPRVHGRIPKSRKCKSANGVSMAGRGGRGRPPGRGRGRGRI